MDRTNAALRRGVGHSPQCGAKRHFAAFAPMTAFGDWRKIELQ